MLDMAGRSRSLASKRGEQSSLSTRGDGKRFVVRADEQLTASLELAAAVRTGGKFVLTS